MADEWDDEVESGQNFASANYTVPVPSSSKGTDDDWNNEPFVSSSNKNKEDDDWGKDDNNSSENRNDFGGRRGGGSGGRGGRFINGRTFNRDDRNGYGNKNGHDNDDDWSKNDNGDNFSRNRENTRGGGRGRGGRGRDRDGGGDRDRNGGFGRDRDGGGERGRNGGFGRDRDGGGDRGRDGGGDRGRNGGFGRDRDRRNGSNDEGKHFGDNGEKKKDLYIPPEPTEDEQEIFGQGISTGINFSKYDSIPVKVSGDDPPKPISCFDEANLKPLVLDNVKKSGYTKPTPIQKNGIPIVMAKRDLMACAQTGSGKTAAFLLPIINDLLTNSQDLSVGKPHALIVSPTRELTIQIFEEARKFARGSYLKITIVYGGTGVKHQGDNIGKGCHILVATPGRLLDFVERGSISFEDCRFVVLDEADRMLDMGFLPSVEKVMDNPTMTPQTERQTLMFSATFPQEIQHLAGRFLNNYIFLSVGIVGGACADVEQNFYEVTRFSKRAKLTDILDENENNARGTMVFVETQRNADFLASLLSETKYPTTSIHGARLQREREMALRDFKNGKMSVLIATSVAARGLDIKNVDHVINYDLPKSIDEYVHRIGRTGRVGNKGKATSFFDSEHDAALAPDLIKILQQADQEVPDFLLNAGGNRSGSYNSDKFGGKDVRTMDKNSGVKYAVPEPHEPVEDW